METTIYSACYGAWLLAGLGFVCQGARGNPRIALRVLNPAKVPAKTLHQAERVAAAILDAAGIEVTWHECPCLPDHLPDRGPNEFWLHLLKDRPSLMHRDTTGFAVLMPARDGAVSYAGVVWPAVEEVAAGLESEVSDVLGATVAHEIGHVLLGSNAHARSGIMCRRFQSREMRKAASGALRFTPEQARRMRARLSGQTVCPDRQPRNFARQEYR